MYKVAFSWHNALCLASCLVGTSVAAVPGTLRTDWVGNTFGGAEIINPAGSIDDPLNRSWVQNYVANIWVSENGTLFAMSDWDEGGRTAGIYKDGKVLGHLADPAKAIFAYNGDIVGDRNFVYVTTGVDWGNWDRRGYGIRRYHHNGQPAPWTTGKGYQNAYIVVRDSGSSPKVSRLAIDTTLKELYLLDTLAGGTVLVFDLASMSQAPKAKWTLKGVTAMVADQKGFLWVIRGNHVEKLTNRGAATGIIIASLARPERLTIGRRGKLHVFDDSTLQVHIFENLSATPVLSSTFGVLGGIYSGVVGKVAPDKLLPKCAGLALDSSDNLYLAWGGVAPVAGTDLRSYSPSGSMRWQLLGHTFVACGGFDPGTDGQDIYYRDHHYTMDYSKTSGKGWKYESFLWDRKNDEPTVFGGSVIVRRLGGKIILASTASDQMSGGFRFYRMDQQVATPAGTLADGSWAWWIERNGNVWNADGAGKIKRFPYLGLDAEGNPRYNASKPDTFPRPKEVTGIQRIHYDPSQDALYVSGYDDANPSPNEWGRTGSVFARYDGWTSGQRKLAWKIVLPRDNLPEYTLKDMWVEGEYAFFITCKSEPSTIVYVFSLVDGSLVGTMTPGPEIAGDVSFFGSAGSLGWVDMAFGIQAFKRANGEYMILFEEDLHAKNVMYRWCPKGSCAPATVGVETKPARTGIRPMRINLDAGRLELQGRFNLQGRALPEIAP